jgi:diacylglycerol kinase family enzyme
MHTVRSKEVWLTRENNESPVHIDGSPIQMEKELHIKIVEDGLKVLVKKRF